jgi:hypothetical protein
MYETKKIKHLNCWVTTLEENHLMEIEVRIAYGIDKFVGF